VQLGNLRILIENTAGMGSAAGARLEEVGAIVDGLAALGAGACLDTAHLFAAGYDIATEAGLEKTIARIDGTIGLERVFVFHVNDSKIALGGRVDRHAHIGEGKIKAEAFARILQHPRLGCDPATGLPGRVFLLETPIEDPGDDRRNVAKLWELSGVAGPAAEKGYSMLTAALKKKLLAQKKVQRKIAGIAAKKSGAKGIRNAKKG